MIENFFIFSAKYLHIVSIAIALIYFYRATPEIRKRMAVFAVISFGLAFVLAVGSRTVYDNPRPFAVGGFEPLIAHEADNSFPSDHTLLAAAIASLMLALNIHIGIWLWLIAGIVGLSRVYVGVHYFTDIIGSGLIAALSVTIAYAIIHKLWNRNKQTNSPSP